MNMRHCPTCYSNQFIEKPDGLYCAFCDNRYIEPKQRSDRQEMMLEIAYTDLRNMNFIEAESSFEEIIALYPDLHEAYWGCLSSRCGLKYEEDYSGKKIPTCCLPHMQSILEDSYYQKATALADPEIAAQYRDTAEYIERVRQTWIEHASKLPPYDIFISYKESDAEHGISRTQDSINAQELYAHLTRQGYRVFYSHDSLRDVVGEKYEPYIFHALETAKVMIVYGTKPEYINSAWLKNEWMRYLKKIEQGEKQKGSLLVVYEGFSPYELPGAMRFQGIDGKSRSCYADIDLQIEKLIAPFKLQNSDKKEPLITSKIDFDIQSNPPQEQKTSSTRVANVCSIGTNDKDDPWPQGEYSPRINRDKFSVVYFHMTLLKSLDFSGTIYNKYQIYNSDNNLVHESEPSLDVKSGYDTFATGWILKGRDGTFIPSGEYRFLCSINNSPMFSYSFTVYSEEEEKANSPKSKSLFKKIKTFFQ